MTQAAALRAGAAALGLTLTDRQSQQLLAYAALILKWNKVYNLTALRDPALVLTPLGIAAVGALAGLVPAFKAYRTDVASNLTPSS